MPNWLTILPALAPQYRVVACWDAQAVPWWQVAGACLPTIPVLVLFSLVLILWGSFGGIFDEYLAGLVAASIGSVLVHVLTRGVFVLGLLTAIHELAHGVTFRFLGVEPGFGRKNTRLGPMAYTEAPGNYLPVLAHISVALSPLLLGLAIVIVSVLMTIFGTAAIEAVIGYNVVLGIIIGMASGVLFVQVGMLTAGSAADILATAYAANWLWSGVYLEDRGTQIIVWGDGSHRDPLTTRLRNWLLSSRHSEG